MPNTLAKLLTGSNWAIVLHAAVVSFPMPVIGNEGQDVTKWRDNGGYSPTEIDISFTANGQTTLTGPVGLFGVRAGVCYFIDHINGGNDIKIGGANTGCAYQVSAVGTFDRLIVGGEYGATVTPSNGATVTVTASPLWVV